MGKNEEEQDELGLILDSLGPRPLFIITVRRIEPEMYSGYLGSIYVHSEDDSLFETLRQEFGGGKFYLQIKDSKGRYLEHRTVSICAPPYR